MLPRLRYPVKQLGPMLALAMLLGGCDTGATSQEGQRGQTSRSSEEANLPRVIVRHPEIADAEQAVALPGTLEGFEVASLHARATGYIRSVKVDIGDHVEKGEVIAQITVPEMRAKLDRARAELGAAEAKIQHKEAQIELARITRERLVNLRQRDQGAVTQQRVDEAKANIDIKAAELRLAKRRVEVARAELERLRTLSDFATLRAPFTGLVTERRLHPGALVRRGTDLDSDARPIVELVRTDPLRLAFQVPESFVPYLEVGHEVKATFKAMSGEERTYRVTRMADAVDPDTRYMRAEIDVPNPKGALRPGMYASVHLGVTTKKDALVLPSHAVRGPETDRHVLLVRSGVLEKQKVTVASDDGRRAVIVGGLSPEALVMVSGSALAGVGSRVEAVVEEGGKG